MNDIETAIKYISNLYSIMFIKGKAWELDLAIQALQEKAERENLNKALGLDLAIQDLQEKAGRENLNFLTLEQLKERNKPVWTKADVSNGGYWCLCSKGVVIAPSGRCFTVEEIPHWKFYDHEPKADNGWIKCSDRLPVRRHSMREIKFRGYDREDKQWRHGNYYFYTDTILCAAMDEETKKNEHHCILFDGFCDWNMPRPHYRSEVDSKTVGQYTGFKDKNGVEIYEGDVLKCVDKNNNIEFIAAVEFGNPNFEYNWGWQLRRVKGDKPNLDILRWVGMDDARATCEVIGNIYDKMIDVAENE